MTISRADVYTFEGPLGASSPLCVADRATRPPVLVELVVASLFSWRRSEDSDPVDDDDRKGWWADTYQARPVGSRLWLLCLRGKLFSDTPRRVEELAHEALDWMIAEGYAARVDVEARRTAPNRLDMAVRVIRQNGTGAELRFDDWWRPLWL